MLKQGLHRLMRVNQKENCGNDTFNRGADFIFLSMRQTFKSDKLYIYFYLTPEYQFNVAFSQ